MSTSIRAGEEPHGRHELKAQFVELRARGLSYADIANAVAQEI